MGTNQKGLWNASYGEIGASLKALENAGITLDDLARLRSDKKLAKEFAKLFRSTTDTEISELFSHEENGIIYLSPLVSDGTTGSEWIGRLEKNGYRLSDWAKDVLRQDAFVPTESGTVHNIAIIKGEVFSDDERITKKIRKKAKDLGFLTPNVEVACLIREKYSDEELKKMGLTWIVTMHEPIIDSDGVPGLLCAVRGGGGRWLNARYDRSGPRWYRDDGFAFSVPQVGTQKSDT